MTAAADSRQWRGSGHIVRRGQRAQRAQYATQGFVSLLRHTVEKAHRAALGEFLEGRPVFQRGGGSHLLLSQFLAELRKRAGAGGRCSSLEIADWAYDRILDKFSSLPKPEDTGQHVGPDYPFQAGWSGEVAYLTSTDGTDAI